MNSSLQRFVDGVFNSAHVRSISQESPNAFYYHRILNQPEYAPLYNVSAVVGIVHAGAREQASCHDQDSAFHREPARSTGVRPVV